MSIKSYLSSHLPTMKKAIAYRATCGADTFCVALLASGNVKIAASTVGLEFFSKFAIFYGFERCWNMGRADIVAMLRSVMRFLPHIHTMLSMLVVAWIAIGTLPAEYRPHWIPSLCELHKESRNIVAAKR